MSMGRIACDVHVHVMVRPVVRSLIPAESIQRITLTKASGSSTFVILLKVSMEMSRGSELFVESVLRGSRTYAGSKQTTLIIQITIDRSRRGRVVGLMSIVSGTRVCIAVEGMVMKRVMRAEVAAMGRVTVGHRALILLMGRLMMRVQVRMRMRMTHG